MCNADIKVVGSLQYYFLYSHKPYHESLHSSKKPHQNTLNSFKDLSIHRDRQREAALFYTML
jgi:hypothetical protein